MTNKYKAHQAAHFLYFTGKYSEKEIALKAEVSERTILNWINEGGWEKLRHYAMMVPMQILCNLMEQLGAFQKFINGKSEVSRYPAIEEAGIQQKLINCILKMQNFPTGLIKTYGYAMCPISDIVDEDDLVMTDNKEAATQAEAEQSSSPDGQPKREWLWDKYPVFTMGIDNRSFYNQPRPKECFLEMQEAAKQKQKED
jgi:hypothetical protein